MNHLAFIVDGNGRWAEARNLPRNKGHEEGAKAVLRVILAADELKIPCVSFYAFSTENFRREQKEVSGIFAVIKAFLEQAIMPLAKERDYQVRFIGNLSLLPEDFLSSLSKVNAETLNNRGMKIVIAVGYGGREEIVSAVNKLILTKSICEDYSQVTYEDIESHLYTANLPDPDVIVRFGGHKRLSNFMPLQSAYSELMFLDKLWPDVRREDVIEICRKFGHIQRNFGGRPNENQKNDN